MVEMIIIWIGLPLLLLLISYGVGLAFVLITRKPMSFTLSFMLRKTSL